MTVTDGNGSIVHVQYAHGAGRENVVYLDNAFWGHGLRAGRLNANDPDWMLKRIVRDVVNLGVEVVFIEIGTADTASDSYMAGVPTAIERLLSDPAMAAITVIWFDIPMLTAVPPYSATAAATFNAALADAATRHPNLWVVPTQRIWDEAFGGTCPVMVTPTLMQPAPLETCFLDQGQDAHYSGAGHGAMAVAQDEAIAAVLADRSFRDTGGYLTRLRAAVGAPATASRLATVAPGD